MIDGFHAPGRNGGKDNNGEDGQIFEAIGMGVLDTLDDRGIAGMFDAARPVVDRCAADKSQAPVEKHAGDQQHGPESEAEQGMEGSHGIPSSSMAWWADLQRQIIFA